MPLALGASGILGCMRLKREPSAWVLVALLGVGCDSGSEQGPGGTDGASSSGESPGSTSTAPSTGPDTASSPGVTGTSGEASSGGESMTTEASSESSTGVLSH